MNIKNDWSIDLLTRLENQWFVKFSPYSLHVKRSGMIFSSYITDFSYFPRNCRKLLDTVRRGQNGPFERGCRWFQLFSVILYILTRNYPCITNVWYMYKHIIVDFWYEVILTSLGSCWQILSLVCFSRNRLLITARISDLSLDIAIRHPFW